MRLAKRAEEDWLDFRIRCFRSARWAIQKTLRAGGAPSGFNGPGTMRVIGLGAGCGRLPPPVVSWTRTVRWSGGNMNRSSDRVCVIRGVSFLDWWGKNETWIGRLAADGGEMSPWTGRSGKSNGLFGLSNRTCPGAPIRSLDMMAGGLLRSEASVSCGC